MYSKSAYLKAPVVLVTIAIALAAALLCGAQPAYADSVQYVEKSWDGAKVVSETKTAECAPITKDTENIQGWYYVSGDIESKNRITVAEGAEANIILTDGSKLTLEKGINVHWKSKLNIYAQQEETGELVCYADTNKENAPIGSDNNSGPNGSITIHGGKITAKNDNKAHAAGIGAGKTGAGGIITIYGGTIEARGGNGSAGIGGGDAYGPGRDGGTITIYGGDVKAYGGGGAAGIGGGRGGNGGSITIWGGKVYAKGGPESSYSFPNNSGAGIGSGDDDAGSTATTGGGISIYGGDVEAEGGPDGAGIGGGDSCRGGIITITGGTVKATGGKNAAGIGGGCDRDGGTINIGGTARVEAHAGYDGAAIGGGDDGNGGTINISGGTVTADGLANSGNSSGAGIGGGYKRGGGAITISGGTVEATGGSGNGSGIGNGKGGTDAATTITLKYAEDTKGISVKANSYRYNDDDTTVTLKMENVFTDKDTGESFAAASYTGNDLNQFKNRTLVYYNTHTITVSETQGGSVAADKSRAEAGSAVTLTVAPDDNQVLKPGTLKAVAGGAELALAKDAGDSSKYTFTMPAADVTVTAEFVQKAHVESISLSKEAITLAVDRTETLAATILPEDTDAAAVDRTVAWKSSNENVATVDASGKVTAVSPGAATITATATNGTQDAADDKRATCAVTVIKAEVAAPTIASKVYNGKAQTADIAESDRYAVTENAGGTNAGEYDVKLTLKDAAKYKWADSEDAAKTLKFKITKAENKVAVSLKGWVNTGSPNAPVVKADYGADRAAFAYKAKGAEDSAYSKDVPAEAGAYTVRATIAESDNYLAGSATDDFVISGESVTLTLIGSAIDGHLGEPQVLTVPKGSTVEDLANSVDELAYNALLARFTQGAYAPYYRVLYFTSKPLKEYGGWDAVEAEDLTCSASPLTDDTTYYVPLWKAIEKVELSTQAPSCGTDMKSVKPVATAADGSSFKLSAWKPMWWDAAGDEEIEKGTIEGGKSYVVRADLEAEFGYYFADGEKAPAITVTGADGGSASLFPVGTIASARFTVTAEHDFSTYVASGNAITSACSGCGERATLTIGAPTLTTYGQTGEDMSAEATITDASGIRGDRPVSYYKANSDGTRGEALAGAPTDAGKYWAEITLGEGESAATVHVTYEIAAADISKATVTLAEKSYVYDGKAKEPAAKVTLGGRELVAGTDYDVSYKGNVDVGTATVTVTGRGNYAGSAEATFAIEEPAAGGVTMHRLYNPNSGEHFFTASAYERDAVVAAGWTYEGEGWTAPESGDPVYRLYNPNAGEHHYTRSEYERDHLVSLGWSDEGTGWRSAGDDGVPLLRVYNPNAFANNHHYTASAAERDWLVSLGWQDEGVGWYGL